MPFRTYYFWDIGSVQQQNVLENRPVVRVMEKLRAKFGNGPIVAVGDECRLNEEGNPVVGIKSDAASKFIHVPNGQQTIAIKVLLEKMREVAWKKGDKLVLLSADAALSRGVTAVKAKGVDVYVIGNRLNELFISLHGTPGGRFFSFQWHDVLT